jgi:sugar-specific transcriptional regulator TrmB
VVDPARLEVLGLTPAEAKVYTCLLGHDWLGAPGIADLTGTPRSSVYLVLRSLLDMGLVEGGAGYGSRHRAVPPSQAVPALLERHRQLLQEQEQAVDDLLPRLESIAAGAEKVEEEVIEVLRSPNAVSDRFDRLQLEAADEVDVMVKAPIVLSSGGNPAELTALRRGVRYRGLYEQRILDHPEVRPHLARWLEAGEQVRVYPRALPLKMALFDGRITFLPLPTPGHANGVTSVLIRHETLGTGLQILFNHLWADSEPFTLDRPPGSGVSSDSPRADPSGRRRKRSVTRRAHSQEPALGRSRPKGGSR